MISKHGYTLLAIATFCTHSIILIYTIYVATCRVDTSTIRVLCSQIVESNSEIAYVIVPLRFNLTENPSSALNPRVRLPRILLPCPDAFPESGTKMSETEIQQLVEMVGEISL